MFKSICSLLIITFVFAFTAGAQDAMISLEGLDPVMLTQGKEVQGDLKYRVTRGQYQYLFANEENKATSTATPEGLTVRSKSGTAQQPILDRTLAIRHAPLRA